MLYYYYKLRFYMSDKQPVFKERINHFSEVYRGYTKRYNLIATLRVAVFLGFLITFFVFANDRDAISMALTALLFPFAFGFVVKAHKKIAYNRKQALLLKKINEKEVCLSQGHFKEQDTGAEYQDKNHPYINDLDIFGDSSIFQLLNRTTTKGGRDLLANWLSRNTTPGELLQRQEAVKELSDKLDWRQELEAKGLHYKMQESNSDDLITWINTPYPVAKFFKICAWGFPFLIIPSILFNFYTSWPAFASLILVLLGGIVTNRFLEPLKILTNSIIKHISVIGAYAQLIEQLEKSDFKSKKLRSLKLAVSPVGRNASRIIHDLFKVLDLLNSRNNMLYWMINVPLLFDIHIMMQAERWKSKNKTDVSAWFDAVSELEALCSLAGLNYANAEFSFPTFSEEEYHISAVKLGHPLIPESERISNDYRLSGKGGISIITGSNMSGKSTFLRTLGVNISLAQAGAPVCATSLELSIIQLFTSMRTEDNLEEHVSSFYAELQRIQRLLHLVEEGKPVLYMLDEILKGTNSQDRHIGAVALAKQLSKSNSFGLISTHDLALGELAKSMTNIDNYSFNSEIKGDEIIFPYTLEEGVCRSFNASKLMEKIGIEIKEK